MVPALIVYAVIPFGPAVNLFGRQVSLYITDINVGLLYIVSVASVGVYGIILAGYASNSKFPLLASLRASAQLISYEVAVTLTLVSVILMAGSLSMVEHRPRAGQARTSGTRSCSRSRSCIFFIGSLAETNRAPFDMPEAEQELTGGFHTEYSGMRFALFFLAEYANMIVVSSVATTLFLGGWLRPFPNVAALAFLDIVPSWTWFLIKSFVFLYFFIWVRATLPRYRYDQLMRLGWKVLIPLAIVNLVVTGIVKVLLLVMGEAIAFYTHRRVHPRLRRAGGQHEGHRAQRAVPGARLPVRRGAVRAARRAVPRGDPGPGLRRRHRRAVPVRRDAGEPEAAAGGARRIRTAGRKLGFGAGGGGAGRARRCIAVRLVGHAGAADRRRRRRCRSPATPSRSAGCSTRAT